MQRRGLLTKKNQIVIANDELTFFDGCDNKNGTKCSDSGGDSIDITDDCPVSPSNGPVVVSSSPPLPPLLGGDAKSVSDETKTSNVEKLFENLLGTESAACLGGGRGGGDDASTAMSSIVPLVMPMPLTDQCYFTLTEALHFWMGGNPFVLTRTGKTESVKALGGQL